MPPKGSPKRVAKSPIKASPKPMTPTRSSSRTISTPSRLGIDDTWGTGSARDWVSAKDVAATPDKSGSKATAKKSDPSTMAVGAADVLVLGGGMAAFFYAISAIKLPKGASLMGAPTVSTFAGVALAVALPQLFYVFVWNKPGTFKRWCSKGALKFLGKKPVSTFGKLVMLGKGVQQLALFLWAFYLAQRITTLAGVWSAVLAIPLTQKLCAAGLFIVGQILNVSIYNAIGESTPPAARCTLVPVARAGICRRPRHARRQQPIQATHSPYASRPALA
jgi:hypothetical protein